MLKKLVRHNSSNQPLTHPAHQDSYKPPPSPIHSIRNPLQSIYSKAQLLKQQLQPPSTQQNNTNYNAIMPATCSQHFLDIRIDRRADMQNMRKTCNNFNTHKSTQIQRKIMAASSTNWKQHTRNKTSSLIKFLTQNKTPQTTIKNKIKGSPINSQVPQKQFQPVGQQYKKEVLYQQSLRSQCTSSRLQSRSLLSSKVQSKQIDSRQASSHKYLRKGARVRQILMRQLRPQSRSSGISGMTYMRQYDQWVPTAMVQTSKEELQACLKLILGEKKVNNQKQVNLDQIQLVYL